MTEKPFLHKKAYANVKSNFIFQDEAAQLILKILDKKGIVNVGGPSQTIFDFAKKNKKSIKKFFRGRISKKNRYELKQIKKIFKDDYKKTNFKDLYIIKQKNNFDKRGILRETFNDKILKKNLFLSIVQPRKKILLKVSFSNKEQTVKIRKCFKGKNTRCSNRFKKKIKNFWKSVQDYII